MSYPNFLLIGAARAGTSALYHYLWQHPQVFMSVVKEPNFMAFPDGVPAFAGPEDDLTVARRSITDPVAYRQLFARVRRERAVGEGSTLYLYSKTAAARIRELVPNVKLLIILRDPVDRAYSSFLHMVRDGREPCATFEQALDREGARVSANWSHMWHYARMGLYAEQVYRYAKCFRAEQLAVFLYDDFQRDPQQILRKAFEFLGVDTSFVPRLGVRYNVSGRPRSARLHQFLTANGPVARAVKAALPVRLRRRMKNAVMSSNLDVAVPPLAAAIRQRLKAFYREDILRLQDLIGRGRWEWLGCGAGPG